MKNLLRCFALNHRKILFMKPMAKECPQKTFLRSSAKYLREECQYTVAMLLICFSRLKSVRARPVMCWVHTAAPPCPLPSPPPAGQPPSGKYSAAYWKKTQLPTLPSPPACQPSPGEYKNGLLETPPPPSPPAGQPP